jgi:hypothetical protein
VRTDASIASGDASEGRLELGDGVGASGARLRRGPAEETRPSVGQREQTRERKRGKQERECGESPPC